MKITVSNYGSVPYTGWLTTTCSADLALYETLTDGTTIVQPGRWVGAPISGGQEIHVFVKDLQQGHHTIDTAGWETREPLGFTGGKIDALWNGKPPDFEESQQSGPCIIRHARWKIPDFVIDLWQREYGDEQSWGAARMLVTCTSPQGTASPSWRLTGAHTLWVFPDEHKLDGMVFGHGQGQALRGAAADDAADGGPVDAWFRGAIHARGPWTKFGPLGIGSQADQPATPWLTQHAATLTNNACTWNTSGIGPAPNSGVTGAQEDQGFCVSGNAFAPDGAGVAHLRLLAADEMARRPNGYREADGSELNWETHPQLVMWSGRPHYSPAVSPDQLGLPQGITFQGGYNGPDRQHWLINTLTEAYMLTGDPLLQQLIRDQSTVFWFGETVDPRLATSHSDAPRAIGWTSLVVAKLLWSLDDYDRRGKVQARYRDRVAIYMQEVFNSFPVGRFEVTTDDRVMQYFNPRPANGAWVPWQHAIAALGLTAAYEITGDIRCAQLAFQAARTVMLHGYDSGLEWDAVAEIVAGQPVSKPYVQGVTAERSAMFGEWMGAVPALLNRYRQVIQLIAPDVAAKASFFVNIPGSKWEVTP